MIEIGFNLLLIIFLSLFNPTHRVSITGKDVLINDISKPYNQEEIDLISDLKAYSNKYGDVSNYIILYEDNYNNNKEKEGVYIQKYKIDLEEYENYYYELLIYNIDFNKADYYEEINISTNIKNYLDEDEIIKAIKNHLESDIYNYKLLDSNYIDNKLKGSYLQTYLVTTTNNKVFNVKVLIDVVENEKNNKPLILGGLLLVVLGTYYIYSRKGRKIKIWKKYLVCFL